MLVTLNQTEVEALARTNKIEYENFADLIVNRQVYGLIEETIAKANAKVSSSEQIKKFFVLERDFSAELDEITPTMNLKRNLIAEKFGRRVLKLYE